jgi:hypothetical protein
MTRISGLGTTGTASKSPVARRTTTNRFTMNVGSPAVPATMAPIEVCGLLTLQDEAAPALRDRAARRDGEVILGALAALRTALLDGGRFDPAHLRNAIGCMNKPADPALHAVLAAIRLRARVELARHERV